MDVLNTKIKNIKDEKALKVRPENIKNGVSIFGIQGTYTGLDTSDANATAEDILLNKTAYVNGTKITGTIPRTDYVDRSSYETTYVNGFVSFKTGLNAPTCVKNYVKLTEQGRNLAPVIGLTADKIKKDEVILGITGTYSGEISSDMILFSSMQEMEDYSSSAPLGCIASVLISETTRYPIASYDEMIPGWSFFNSKTLSSSSFSKILVDDGGSATTRTIEYVDVDSGSLETTRIIINISSDNNIMTVSVEFRLISGNLSRTIALYTGSANTTATNITLTNSIGAADIAISGTSGAMLLFTGTEEEWDNDYQAIISPLAYQVTPMLTPGGGDSGVYMYNGLRWVAV